MKSRTTIFLYSGIRIPRPTKYNHRLISISRADRLLPKDASNKIMGYRGSEGMQPSLGITHIEALRRNPSPNTESAG